MKYPHSQAAALIRKELKRNNIPAKVSSKSYSMGDSVRVLLTENPLPATVKKVEEFTAKFQYGHFDGMTDMYEISNNNDDLPQAKHVFVNTEYSDEFKQLVWDYVRNRMHGGDDAPESYQEACNYNLQGEWGSSWVHRVLSGIEFPEFWRSHKARQKVEALPVPRLQLVK